MVRAIVMISLILISAATASKQEVKLPDYPYDKSKIYSGYLKNEKFPDKSLHYIFVESEKDPLSSPVLLWLNGGPGCSSLYGFVNEHGPAVFKEQTSEFEINNSAWNKKANVLYLESPVGVGFSVAKKPSDLNTNDEITAADNFQALLSFYNDFPEYRENGIFLSGESYGGMYVPFLASKIIDYNASVAASQQFNFKGILIGNGYIDPNFDNDSFFEFAYGHNLISIEVKAQLDKNCGTRTPYPQTTVCQKYLNTIQGLVGNINNYDIYRKCFKSPQNKEFLGSSNENVNYVPFIDRLNRTPKPSSLTMLFGLESASSTDSCVDTVGINSYFNRDDVKKALNVDASIQFSMCSTQLSYQRDPAGSIKIITNKILKSKYKIVIYSGDSDAAIPFTGTRAWINNLRLKVKTPTARWRVNNDKVSGTITEYDGLSFITVMGVGHMVPMWSRPEAFKIIDYFLYDIPL